MFRKILLSLLLSATAVLSLQAQGLKRVYDETLNPAAQLDDALAKARAEGKHVVCQIGGNWCIWCLKFADFVEKDSTVSRMVADNYVYIHLNYNPRSNSAADAQTAIAMKRLGNPVRFGFPVLVVLDGTGTVLHTQDSSFLEEGKGYNTDRMLRFFKSWTPQAVREAQQ